MGSIYAAGLDSTRWPTVLNQVSGEVGAAAGTIWMHDFRNSGASFETGGKNVSAYVGFDENTLVSYADHFSGINVWAANEEKLAAGSAVTSSILYPDSKLKHTEFYADWLRQQDLFYALGAVVEKQESCAVKLSFLRSERAGVYQAHELNVMRQLMPHLQTAVAMHRQMYRLEALAASTRGVLDLIRFGVILLTDNGTLMYANHSARSIATMTGALRFGPGGVIEAASVGATAKLQNLIRTSALTGAGKGLFSGGAMRLPTRDHRELQVFVAPMPSHATPFGESVSAAIFCNGPDAAVGGLVPSLQAIYQMTLAEASLTEALVNGQSLREFAEQRSTTLNTVRTQLKAATAKAGAKRQVDLVRMILTGPAILNINAVPPRR